MILFIKTFLIKGFEIQFNKDDTILNIKKKIQTLKQINFNNITLINEKKILLDGMTMSDCNIANESIIIMIINKQKH